MQSTLLRRLIKPPMILPLLLCVASCGPTLHLVTNFPPPVLLVQEPKPKATPEMANSAQALADHQADKDAWGARGWAAVDTLCHWFKDNGMAMECAK